MPWPTKLARSMELESRRNEVTAIQVARHLELPSDYSPPSANRRARVGRRRSLRARRFPKATSKSESGGNRFRLVFHSVSFSSSRSRWTATLRGTFLSLPPGLPHYLASDDGYTILNRARDRSAHILDENSFPIPPDISVLVALEKPKSSHLAYFHYLAFPLG